MKAFLEGEKQWLESMTLFIPERERPLIRSFLESAYLSSTDITRFVDQDRVSGQRVAAWAVAAWRAFEQDFFKLTRAALDAATSAREKASFETWLSFVREQLANFEARVHVSTVDQLAALVRTLDYYGHTARMTSSDDSLLDLQTTFASFEETLAEKHILGEDQAAASLLISDHVALSASRWGQLEFRLTSDHPARVWSSLAETLSRTVLSDTVATAALMAAKWDLRDTEGYVIVNNASLEEVPNQAA